MMDCRDCIAYKHNLVYMPKHSTADRFGYADRCTVMKEQGKCEHNVFMLGKVSGK